MNKENDFKISFMFTDDAILEVNNNTTVVEFVENLQAIKAQANMSEDEFEKKLNEFWSNFFEMMTAMNA